MKRYTVEFQVPKKVDILARSEEEAKQKAWRGVMKIGYIYAGATEQLEEGNDPGQALNDTGADDDPEGEELLTRED